MSNDELIYIIKNKYEKLKSWKIDSIFSTGWNLGTISTLRYILNLLGEKVDEK